MNAFRYPGSKARLAPWILKHLPEHDCYAEPFCGSAAVLLTKDASTIEVINDRDEHIVHFFEVLRDDGDALADWYESVPYSRQLHRDWSADFREGDIPADPIKRAGRWLYLHTASVNGVGGFSIRRRDRDPTNHHQSKPEKIQRLSRRLRSVVVENLDYTDLVEKYDGNETVFYFDPPYVEAGDSLYGGEFNHGRFADILKGLDSRWLVSYSTVPETLSDDDSLTVVEKSKHNHMRAGSSSGSHEETDRERLIMNFNPDEVTRFAKGQQKQLPGVSTDDTPDRNP